MRRAGLRVMADSERVRNALNPLRRSLLQQLQEPASASELARVLGLPRQRINYHLRAMERDGLVELVAERRRRGCTERLLQATAENFVVDPQVLSGGSQQARRRDRFAADHLVATAAGVVRDVGRQSAESAAAGTRLLTFTVETELTFETPAEVHRFAGAVAEALATLAGRHGSSDGARYRVVVGGHPADDRDPEGDDADGQREA